MPIDIRHHKVIIAVFAMPDCPACEEYTPRLIQAATQRASHAMQRHHPDAAAPFRIWNGKPLAPNTIPILIYDVTSKDPQLQAFADRFKIEATPTTLILRQPSGVFRAEGSLNAAQIAGLLDIAISYQR